MDATLRELERLVRARPLDLELAVRYERSALAVEPGRLDDLVGALVVPSASGESWPPPRWRRAQVGGRRPVAGPLLPMGDRLRERWRAPGAARYVGAGLVLVESPERALEARCARTGGVLWSVPSHAPPGLRGEDEGWRATRLGWAVSGWGAVEAYASYEAVLERRRFGRVTPRGRTTERAVVGRGPAQVEAGLHAALAPGGWTREPPEELLEAAGTGQPLAGSELRLEDWDDDLLALALDPGAPLVAVAWRDEDTDWVVLRVDAGGAHASSVGPAGFAIPPGQDDPFPQAGERDPLGERCPLPGGALVLERDPPRVVTVDADGRVASARDVPRALAHGWLLPSLGGALLLAAGPDGGPVAYEAGPGTLEPRYPGWPPLDALEGRKPIPWTLGPGDPLVHAVVLAAPGALYLQLGEEALVAYGADEAGA